MRLFPLRANEGDYLTNTTTADSVLSRAAFYKLDSGQEVTLSSQQALIPYLENVGSGETATQHLAMLFEGVTAGTGKLLANWYYKGKLAATDSVKLELRSVKDYYQA